MDPKVCRKKLIFNSLFLSQITADETITIVCKAWAKNIQHDAHEGRGATRFRMFISSGKSVAIALKSLTTVMLLGLAYSTIVNLGMY